MIHRCMMSNYFTRKQGIRPLIINLQIQNEDGRIAIYDATNVERSVRNALHDFAVCHGFKLFFVESECNDPSVIQTTVREVLTVINIRRRK